MSSRLILLENHGLTMLRKALETKGWTINETDCVIHCLDY